MKGISQIIALLIVLSIVVGVGVAISMFLGGFIMKQTPKGGELFVQNIDLRGEVDGKRIVLWLELRGLYQGAGYIEVKNVTVTYDTSILMIPSEYTIKNMIVLSKKIFKPNEYVKIIAKGSGPAYSTFHGYTYPSRLELKITYCFADTNYCESIVKIYKGEEVFS